MTKLPKGVDINKLIDDLRNFSWEAYEIFNYYSEKLNNYSYKKQLLDSVDISDPVTAVDLKINKLILSRIRQNYKRINWDFLTEENAKMGIKSSANNSDWLWVIDPLDGTKDFIQETGDYAMHLALNYKKKPYLGLVLIPSKEELWMSVEQKVWCEDQNGLKKYPNIIKKDSLKRMRLVTSRNHLNEKLKILIANLQFKENITMGSIGCKIASIVRGDSDIYISLSLKGQSAPKDWDFAAPEAILRGAGGAITDIDNRELVYDKPDYLHRGLIIASNDHCFHSYICNKVKEIIIEKEIFPLSF